MVKGVRACDGEAPWDHVHGGGKVTLHSGHYADCLAKGNELWLFVCEIFGGVNREGVALLDLWRLRAKHGVDRTDYATTDSAANLPRHFSPHYAQLISKAVVIGDAQRSRRVVAEWRVKCERGIARAARA